MNDKKLNKNKLNREFFLNFIGLFLFFAIGDRYFPTRGHIAISWNEVYNNLPYYILFSLLGALVIMVGRRLFK
jgi:hypothetical protein